MTHHAVPDFFSPATFGRCVLQLVAAVFFPGVACASAINVSINTATLSGSSGSLAFDLTDGDSTVNNSGTLTKFLTDAMVGTATRTGGVTGALPGPVTIVDSSFFNELLVP